MIYLLFKIVFTEMALILTLLFRNPLRKFVIMGLDRLKRGRGPLVAKSVGATVLVVLCSAVYSAMEIQRRAREGGAINPTDEVLMANLLLQASLMDMFYLFFTTVFTEMALILALLFESPLRKLLILGLDKLKQGRGPLVAKSVGATVLVVLSSAVYNVVEIHKRSRESGALNPTEEVLVADLLLEASLMGFSLFLAVMMDRLHSSIKRKQILEEVINPNKQHNQ